MLVPDLAGPGGERVKLLDFGIAKLGAEHLQGDDIKTRTGQTLGTAAYMSPEQCTGEQTIGGQTDVYSLGVVIFRLLCGRLPFISTSGEMALGMMHLNKQPPKVSEFAPTVSPWLVALVDRMLAKQPAERPTMAQVASELQERLPARTSSRSLAPIAKAEGSDVLWQEALEPTADAPSGDRTGERSPALAGPLGAVATSLQSGVPLAVQSGQSGAGTITRATGQGVSAARPPPSRPLLLAFGVVTLLGGGAGTLWLFAPKPAAAPLQSAATPVLPSAAPAQPAPGGDPAKIAGGGGSGSAGGAPLAGGSAATDPSSGSSSGAAKGTGRSEDAKLARRAPSAKKSERKKEDKPRRPAASKATPIMD